MEIDGNEFERCTGTIHYGRELDTKAGRVSSGKAGGRLSESTSYEQVISEAISEYLKAQLADYTQSPCLASDVRALQDHRAITCPSLKPV